jgi:hypothetical protein
LNVSYLMVHFIAKSRLFWIYADGIFLPLISFILELLKMPLLVWKSNVYIFTFLLRFKFLLFFRFLLFRQSYLFLICTRKFIHSFFQYFLLSHFAFTLVFPQISLFAWLDCLSLLLVWRLASGRLFHTLSCSIWFNSIRDAVFSRIRREVYSYLPDFGFLFVSAIFIIKIIFSY